MKPSRIIPIFFVVAIVVFRVGLIALEYKVRSDIALVSADNKKSLQAELESATKVNEAFASLSGTGYSETSSQVARIRDELAVREGRIGDDENLPPVSRAMNAYQQEKSDRMDDFERQISTEDVVMVLRPDAIGSGQLIADARKSIADMHVVFERYKQYMRDPHQEELDRFSEQYGVFVLYRPILKKALESYHQETLDRNLEFLDVRQSHLYALDDLLASLQKSGPYRFDAEQQKMVFTDRESMDAYLAAHAALMKASDEVYDFSVNALIEREKELEDSLVKYD